MVGSNVATPVDARNRRGTPAGNVDGVGVDDPFDDADFESLYEGEVFFRTCSKCGTRTSPRWSESQCLEEARRYGWRRVPASDRPGAARIDLCGSCVRDAGLEHPQARWGW